MNTLETIQDLRRRAIRIRLNIRARNESERQRIRSDKHFQDWQLLEKLETMRRRDEHDEELVRQLNALNRIRRAYLAEHAPKLPAKFRTSETLCGLVNEEGELIGFGLDPAEALEHASGSALDQTVIEAYGECVAVRFIQEP